MKYTKKLMIIWIIISQILLARTITFAGHTWYVKSGYGGPGPNHWSNSLDNVWVDSSDRLHIKIRNDGGTWYCSEISSEEFTQYGMHRFYVESRLDSLDKNVVMALFLYKNDTTEVDIEFSKWGNENSWFNTEYVVQPGSDPGNVERFFMNLSGTYTTHYFDWHSSWIEFKSIHGHYEQPPDSNYLIQKWFYTGDDIPADAESLRIHINLWLYNGTPPSNNQEVEVIIHDADFPSSGIDENENTDVFLVSTANPNPFFNKTTLKYQLPETTEVNISIYNTLGQKVKNLYSGKKHSGIHEISWNGTDNSGEKLPGGVYFLRFQAEKQAVNRKIIFIR